MKRQHSHKACIALPTNSHKEIIDDLTSCLSASAGHDVDYLTQHIFSKYVSEDTDPPSLRRSRAIDKWLATDLVNGDTNHRLLFTDPGFPVAGIPYGKLMERIRMIIRSTLGSVPPMDVLYGTFSGGASSSRSRSESLPQQKFVGQVHVTSDCSKRFLTEAPNYCHWQPYRDFKVVSGAVMFTVPKSTVIDRVACKEPDLNMWCQKGIGGFIRRRLRRNGINLNDQSINGNLAREASVSRELATIDLSSASDSISTRLVFEVLPVDWFLLLDDCRSKFISIDGDLYEPNMFSTMGNGFTFELESLIFWAITRAVCYFCGVRGKVSVYGDDIIAPTDVVPQLVEVLAYLGFRTNPDKTFASRDCPIRESCGTHWYNGIDIKPFYLRSPVLTLIDLIKLLNQVYRWSTRLGTFDPTFLSFWRKWRTLVPERLWGGQDLDSTFSLVTGHAPRDRLVERVKTSRFRDDLGPYLFWLRSGDGGCEVSFSTSRRSSNTTTYVYKRNPVSRYVGWFDYGPPSKPG